MRDTLSELNSDEAEAVAGGDSYWQWGGNLAALPFSGSSMPNRDWLHEPHPIPWQTAFFFGGS